jgi:alpha-L-glutamate ligase-like protein
MFKTYLRLRRDGVLSINQRNSDFVLHYNKRKLFPLVDDKLKTKRLALAAGIAVPSLYGIIETEQQIKAVEELLQPHSDFVIKPARGSGGEGIIVITNRVQNRYRQVNGKLLTHQELNYHFILPTFWDI